MEHISIPNSKRIKTYSYSPKSINSFSPKSSYTHSTPSSPKYAHSTSADSDIETSVDLGTCMSPIRRSRNTKSKVAAIPDFGKDDDEKHVVKEKKHSSKKKKRTRRQSNLEKKVGIKQKFANYEPEDEYMIECEDGSFLFISSPKPKAVNVGTFQY